MRSVCDVGKGKKERAFFSHLFLRPVLAREHAYKQTLPPPSLSLSQETPFGSEAKSGEERRRRPGFLGCAAAAAAASVIVTGERVEGGGKTGWGRPYIERQRRRRRCMVVLVVTREKRKRENSACVPRHHLPGQPTQREGGAKATFFSGEKRLPIFPLPFISDAFPPFLGMG